MKRLLFLAPQPFFSQRGTTLAELEIVRALCARGVAVDVLTYNEGVDVEVPGATIHRTRRIPFPRLGAALRDACVAVNPRTQCDGVPQKNLNYMGAGLPLVAFRGSLHPYQDGKTGLAVDPVDPAALAAGLRYMLDHPDHAARLGRAARRLAESSYSWRSSAGRVEELYRGLLSPVGRTADSPSEPRRLGRGG